MPEIPPTQRRPAPWQTHRKEPEPTELAVLLAQAEQRLAQERLVMQARLDRERALRRIQVAMGWVIVVMLPSVAAFCVGVILDHENLPDTVVGYAGPALFVDIVGLVVVGWRTLLVRNMPYEPLTPVTRAPELHQQIEVETTEIRVVTLEED